ncbi:uncharacterized protein LOC129894743 [Solanum dulcamara]|uniref:uncharacterized protein LOC129894743 n=1 Tax=Solanum dulcamara TaxID=45834 RepID=UPI0024866111|nr:uncharacterized protein LOC129894743 [Solanum dulcamara]
MVANPRATMSKFISGVSNFIAKECRTAIIVKKMEISRFMTFVEQIEGEKIKEMRVRDSKKARVPYPKSQGEGGATARNPSIQRCAKYGKRHEERCLMGLDAWYQCGKMGHMRSDCPLVANKGGDGYSIGGQVKQGAQAQPKGGQRKNCFYALHARKEVDESRYVVTSMLQVFNFDVYLLLDQGANLSFVTPYIAMRLMCAPSVNKTFLGLDSHWWFGVNQESL